MATSRLEAFRDREVPAEIDRFVKRNLAIVDRIAETLTDLGWSQNELARQLGKRPSQVSKWMTGLQNMTLATISELETVLGVELLAVVQPKATSRRIGARALSTSTRYRNFSAGEQALHARPKSSRVAVGSASSLQQAA